MARKVYIFQLNRSTVAAVISCHVNLSIPEIANTVLRQQLCLAMIISQW